MAHCQPIRDAIAIGESSLALAQAAEESARQTADTLEAVVQQIESALDALRQQLADCEADHDDSGEAFWCSVYRDEEGPALKRELVADDALERYRKRFRKSK